MGNLDGDKLRTWRSKVKVVNLSGIELTTRLGQTIFNGDFTFFSHCVAILIDYFLISNFSKVSQLTLNVKDLTDSDHQSIWPEIRLRINYQSDNTLICKANVWEKKWDQFWGRDIFIWMGTPCIDSLNISVMQSRDIKSSILNLSAPF